MRRALQVLLAVALGAARPATAAEEEAKTVSTIHDAAAADALPDRHHITIPTVDISGAADADDLRRHVVVAAGSQGTDWQHPHMLLLPDGKTLFAVWTLGHGGTCGPMKRSDDGGLTWCEPLGVPDNWTSMRNCPTIHRLVDAHGKARLVVFARARDGSFWRSTSEDGGRAWSPMKPAGFGGVVPPMTVLPVEGGRKYLTWTHSNTVLQCESTDGGLTWSKQRRVIGTTRFPGAFACEPEVIRSPDGKQLLMLMRENRRRYNSLYAVSNDEGRTWSKARELPAALTGDRHTAVYAKDGRLVIMFRNRRPVPKSEANGEKGGRPVCSGPTTAWVGRYEDIVEGREGQYRVTLLPYGGYGQLERLPDGTILGISYCRYRPDDAASSIVLTRFNLDELDERLARGSTYTNPIVPGDWSDPGVVRVGDDYYSVCSTSQWQPGIPIVHSKDLVHWRYIGHVLPSHPALRAGMTSGGVYGLEMGYNPHTGMFLVYAPMSNRELWVYCSPRPEGPYEAKHMGRLGIDPGFFADTDGRLYLVMYKGEIYEVERDGLSVKRLVTKIDTSRYKFFEGPDIFKRDGWYYCLYSDGGTRPHQPSTVSVLRSRRIEGPWDEDPGNPVLFATDDGSPIQGPAHGTLIETQKGEWFVTFHAHELSHYSLGRPMCMEPVEWTDNGWWRPRHGKAPTRRAKAPNLPVCNYALAQSGDFGTTQLGPQWFFHCTPPEQGSGWSLSERPGWLRLRPRRGRPIESAVLPAVFLQRVIDKRFRLTARVDFDASAQGHAAGLCMYHDPGMNFWLTTTHRDGNKVFEVGKTNKGKRTPLWTVGNRIGREVHLRIDVDGEETATFFYGSDGREWTRLGESIYFGDSWQDLRNGRRGDPDLGWVGVKKRNAWSAATFGVFAVRGPDARPTPADFDLVRVTTP